MPGAGEYLHPRNPLQATKLDAKSFVQLTVWILVILFAWALARFAFGWLKAKGGQLTGKVADTGSLNPFFS